MQPHTPAVKTIRVQVVAEPLVAFGLERLVPSAHPRVAVSASCEDLAEGIAQLERVPADVVLVDLDGGVGVDGVTEVFVHTRARMLAISASRDLAPHGGAVLAGARGVLQKRAPPALLLKAIEKVHDGEMWVDRAATSRIFMALARQKAAKDRNPEHHKVVSLTRRERQSIAALVSDAEAPTRLVAVLLHISEHTLRNHLTSIYSKRGVPNRVAVYAYAHRHGLTERT